MAVFVKASGVDVDDLGCWFVLYNEVDDDDDTDDDDVDDLDDTKRSPAP